MNTFDLLKYFGCKSSPMEEAAVREWLANDPDGSHLKKYKDARYIFEGMTLYGEEAKAERIENAKKRPGIFKSIFRYSVAAVVAALVMFGTASIVMNQTIDRIAQSTEAVYVPSGKTMELTLEDGTKLWLNSGTKIEYPTVFGRKSRNVKVIDGEVLFDVTKDEKRPFTVSTFASDIRVLGTKFDVVADEDGGIFKTSLIRGKVSVTSNCDKNDRIILSPDQSVTMADGRLAVSQMSDPMSEICWTDGLVNLTDLPFDQLMRRFEKVYNVRIVIDREEMPEIRYSRGKVRVSDGVDHALEMLSKASDFKWSHDRNTNVITIR